MIVVVSNVRVDVGMARKFGLMDQHTQRFFPICCSRMPSSTPKLVLQVEEQEVFVFSLS